ncbi:hypothetical protein KEM54_002337 [Ascosphaera aggregata]|nr:hypothetical protein KEM54_002337 [Ascosphaera aggregata]
MALSKQSRLIILLAIDSVFFLIELTVGYAVHSLALVADSFHMLNDVLSLLVGLWAVKVARTKKSSKSYTYGWQRAETLGALINGVFLIALCVSIFMEAIQRLVEVQVVKQPLLVLVVGSFGLLSNLVGLLLFGHSHDHGEDEHQGHGQAGHVHDGEEHTHTHGELESGHVHAQRRRSRHIDPADENGPVIDVLPKTVMANAEDEYSDVEETPEWTRDPNRALHPANMRREIIEAGRHVPSPGGKHTPPGSSHGHATERSGLLSGSKRGAYSYATPASGSSSSLGARGDHLHSTHIHARPKDPNAKHGQGGHGHSHGDLNMRGVFLHVLGDALGNVGVIAAALIIWLTKWEWRYYSDPAISLIITCIILYTAIPLCKAASRMLLQAVPPGLSIDHITQDIESLPGVVSCHHVHVWQLSDTKLVASLHIQVATEIKDEGSDRYMELAREVRSCLHAYGIHSSTIQPEFSPDASSIHSDCGLGGAGAGEGGSSPSSGGVVGAAGAGVGVGAAGAGAGAGNKNGKAVATAAQPGSSRGSPKVIPASELNGDPSCLLKCGDECATGKECCD